VSRGIRRRLTALERRCPPLEPPRADPACRRQWEAVLGRWEHLLRQAWALLSEAEQGRVTGALAQLTEDFGGPYGGWLRGLRDGWSRLPELPAVTMRNLMLAWLSPEADGGMVCRACGLESPRHKSPPLSEWKLLPGRAPLVGPPPWYDLPELFAACPGCGGSRYEADWPGQAGADPRPWKDLDGHVGARALPPARRRAAGDDAGNVPRGLSPSCGPPGTAGPPGGGESP
jgi:hypothetical protein